jgi:anion-transporting  ArsA/GET3 family ATPase
MVNSLLTRRLIVVTGKGGVGKSAIAAALGLLAARNGRRALVVEMAGQHTCCTLFGVSPAAERTELATGLWATTIDPDRALVDWLASVGGGVPARLLASRSSFRAFAAAAPGARELVGLVEVAQLAAAGGGGRRGPLQDIVILDAPATGHALAMLRLPATYGAIARVGPIAARIRGVQQLLADPVSSAYVAVAQGREMAVTETLELADGLRRDLDRALDAVVVNGTFPRRFTAAEVRRMASLEVDANSELGAAVRAALFVADRARSQANQVARLRRRHAAVVTVPFIFQPRLDRVAAEHLADRLARA